MDQMPSKSIDQHQLSARLDQNNNNNSNSNDKDNASNIKKINACSCTNISIMQLFHEMKQDFPKVPDHIVQQLVAENCHNRRACLEQLQKVACTTSTTPTMYPSKSIHSQQTPRSPLLNGVKWSNNKRMRELSEKFENTSINSSSSSSSSSTSTSEMTSPTATTTTTSTSNEMKIKRPTTLPLRKAPDPPIKSSSSPSHSTAASSTTSVSSISSISHMQQSQPAEFHNVTLDSTASKINDSLNVQLNVTVSPISAKSPIIAKRPAPPPPPIKPTNRFTSQLCVQPEPPFTSMLDQANKSSNAAASASSGTSASGKKSFTKVNFTLRQPTSIIPSPQAPIEIQAGPQSLTYSSTSFNAKQGYESHLTITVAGNGESCIQAVRTLPSSQLAGELNQIDTTINIDGSNHSNCNTNDSDNPPPIRIVSTPYSQFALPQLTSDYRLVDDTELRLRIQRQIKQKQSLECELEKEREKLEMIRLDIITLTAPCMTHTEMKELCDEITRLRSVCERLSDEIDVMTETPVRSPQSISSYGSSNGPPPIPRELRSRRGFSPNPQSLPQLDTSGIRYPSAQPPSYNEVMMSPATSMRNINRTLMSGHYQNHHQQQPADEEKWACSMCTFRNHSLLQICEACELPRVQGITITSSSYRPLLQNNQLQRATNNDNVATAN